METVNRSLMTEEYRSHEAYAIARALAEYGFSCSVIPTSSGLSRVGFHVRDMKAISAMLVTVRAELGISR